MSQGIESGAAAAGGILLARGDTVQIAFGIGGRNSIVGPGIVQFDAEVHKQFRMPYKEDHSLQFRFEAFNALNHPNWQMPNLNVLAGAARPGMPSTVAHQNFGVVTATSTSMRQIQFGLKYSFSFGACSRRPIAEPGVPRPLALRAEEC